MAETPTLDKMLAVKDQSRAIGEFLDWLESEGLVLCGHDGDHYVGHYESTEALLARHFGIDLDAAEREKRAILAELGAG